MGFRIRPYFVHAGEPVYLLLRNGLRFCPCFQPVHTHGGRLYPVWRRQKTAFHYAVRPFRRFGGGFSARHCVTKIIGFACVSNPVQNMARIARVVPGCPHPQTIVRTLLGCYGKTNRLFSMHPTAICQVSEEMRESHGRIEKGKHRPHRDKMQTARQISRSKE